MRKKQPYDPKHYKTWRAKNLDKIRARQREYAKKWRAEHRDRFLVVSRRFCEKHREELRMRGRERYRQNSEKQKRERREWKSKYPEKTRYNVTRSMCKKIDREFALSLEQYSSLMHQDCTYCGCSAKIRLNGIDRVDSRIGYVLGNVVPCCTRCNLMKNNMTVNEFISHMKQIIRYTGREK